MFDLSKILAVVKSVAAVAVPGSTAGIAAGEAVIELVKSIRPTLTTTDQETLDAALPELLEKMDRDVDQAIKDLRGE